MGKRKLKCRIESLESEVRVQSSVGVKWFTLYERAMKHNKNLSDNLEETYNQWETAMDVIKVQAELIEKLR